MRQGDLEYRCIFIPQHGGSPEHTEKWCEKVTYEINALVKRGWEIVHIQGGEIFHMKRGYRMQLEDAA